MSAAKPLPSTEYLRECFDYDPETGVLRWRVRPLAHFPDARARNTWNTKHAGSIAGSVDALGYVMVSVDARKCKAHRIVYAMLVSDDAEMQIDHKNGVRSDNRMENLRLTTYTGNAQNRKRPSNNTSGLKGATYKKANKKWESHITYAGVPKYLGIFATKEEAHVAYCAAADEMHGEFANHGG